MEREQLLTVKEVAERLRLQPETIRVWLRDKTMKGYQISRRAGWLIPESEVQRMLERGR